MYPKNRRDPSWESLLLVGNPGSLWSETRVPWRLFNCSRLPVYLTTKEVGTLRSLLLSLLRLFVLSSEAPGSSVTRCLSNLKKIKI